MPTLRGFTTKNKDWTKQVLDAIKKDPKAKFKLPFKAKNFKTTKNPLKGVQLVNLESEKQTIKKPSWFTKLFI